ncbi:unnamed protein product [Euphydryas editha]|uniref:Lipase n=1 Tax=Euphydryas editha TaxID=104508 RepID=A0AAU9UKF7_EUPED|nr:unnamed protein product [Euphydryas editha]
MASTNNLKFYIFLAFVAIILANVLKSGLFPINNDIKRTLGYPENSLLNFTELSGRYGYLSEEHTLVTEDGYILTIFRINGKQCAGKLKKPPVVLMHGLLLSSDLWLDAGPDAGLAYLISDACYDLWVGNQRGNYYSRRHVRLNPDKDEEFWQFSADEIGLYDIPATIDYVLNTTGEEKLNYIGYSQGAGTFLIMCSERPGYCDKVNILIALAPATRLTNTKSVLAQSILGGAQQLEGLLAAIGIYEALPKGALNQELLAFVCKFSATSEFICGNLIATLDSSHPGSISKETIKISFGHSPAGTSVRTLARYGQALSSDKFQKYDYGKPRNLDIYGEEKPPSYNLSTVTIPFVTLYGKNDNLVATEDVLWLIKELPNVLEAVEVADPMWNHFDVPYSQFSKDLIFPKVNEYLQKYSIY